MKRSPLRVLRIMMWVEVASIAAMFPSYHYRIPWLFLVSGLLVYMSVLGSLLYEALMLGVLPKPGSPDSRHGFLPSVIRLSMLLIVFNCLPVIPVAIDHIYCVRDEAGTAGCLLEQFSNH